MARANSTATIHFGTLQIPVKVYAAAVAARASLHLLERATGLRPRQKLVSAKSGAVLERAELARGYEYAPGQLVELDDAELAGLEDKSGAIEIAEYVPADDQVLWPHGIEKVYDLGPVVAGDAAYGLLWKALWHQRQGPVAAIGQWHARGKLQLVAVVPLGGVRLALYQLYYANERRQLEQVELPGVDATILELAVRLVRERTVELLDLSKYRDGYAASLQQLVERKLAGSVTAALEASLEPPPRPRRARKAPAKRARAARAR